MALVCLAMLFMLKERILAEPDVPLLSPSFSKKGPKSPIFGKNIRKSLIISGCFLISKCSA